MTENQTRILKQIAADIDKEGKELDKFGFGCEMALRYFKAKKAKKTSPIAFNENGIEHRKKTLYNCLAKHLSPEYDKKLLREFYDYWTEIGENQKKMRFEREDTFEIAKRLVRWKKNQEEKAIRYAKTKVEQEKIVAKSPFKNQNL